MTILTILICINIVLALIYAIVKIAKHEPSKGIALAIFFICLPYFGFVVYFISIGIQALLTSRGVDEEAILTHELEIEQQPEHPNVHAELNVVPLGDAMAVSTNAEKRELLLNELEKDWKSNFQVLLAAEQDEDSETAHYAAAEEMEIYRLQQNTLLNARKEYEAHPDNPKYFHELCASLIEILDSDAFSQIERNAYRKRLIGRVQTKLKDNPSIVIQTEYEACLRAYVDLEQYDDAKKFWAEYIGHLQDEDAYHDMLKMYYQLKDKQHFEQLLNELQANKKVRLSPFGLSEVRYWTARLKQEAEGINAATLD